MKILFTVSLLGFLGGLLASEGMAQPLTDLAQTVEIRRTAYGVPHIKAASLEGAAFGLAWCELEDYGERVIEPLLRARGELAKLRGYEALESDFVNGLGYERAVATYYLLDADTRQLMEGFAKGVNYFLDTYPDRFPELARFRFTGHDVSALTTAVYTPSQGQGFVERLRARRAERDSLRRTEAGSNAWAFAPSRTQSGNAILVRNPHLSWTAGYYEAQLTVPGRLDFYGDFRIGGVFAIIGGFNEYLGWCTTNNNPDLDEVYALEADSTQVDHYLLDGLSRPLIRKRVTAKFKNGPALAAETRELLFTPYGPVIHREEGKIYILKRAGDGDYRRSMQYTRMLLSRNLEEWKNAMRMQGIVSSNYTYADAAGNIFYVWNAATPDLPVASGGDSVAVAVTHSHQIWRQPIPFDSLPQLLNPRGGYLHNENDPFHFTNLNEVMNPEDFPDYFPAPRLRLRSQHSLALIHNDDRLSLEEVVARKHSMRMLLADRLKPDLLAALRAAKPDKEVRRAMDYLSTWDNSVAAASSGGVLFVHWFEAYAAARQDRALFATPWSFEQPTTTPVGIADPATAVTAFRTALDSLKRQYGTWQLAWGDVHRLRHGDLDLPVGGGAGGYGCFRVLWFTDAEAGKKKIRGGDGWQLAVEFSDPPRAYSVLAYGQSNDPESPHHTDQATLFAENKMKRVAFTEAAIERDLIRRYRPGE